jgi:hypothetical protein
MEPRTVAGSGLLVTGLLAYAAGVSISDPGRAFSLTAVMVGIVLVALGGVPAGGEP